MLYSLAVSAVEQTAATTDYGNLVAFLSGLAALLSIAITSLRKRKDVSVDEMRQRIKDLEAANDNKDADIATAQQLANLRGRQLFTIRQVLIERGIPDPTQQETKEVE